jgi:hypothetical protein
MKRIDCITRLAGEYNIKIINNSTTVYESGWSKNTILSAGLAGLYDTDPADLIKVLDFGKNNALSGVAGFTLSGVLVLPDSVDFYNIPSGNTESYNISNDTRVYYSYFSTKPSTITHTIQEFAIKPSLSASAFARNVFSAPLLIEANSYVIFEYRLKLNRSATFISNLPFSTHDGYTFTVPITTVALSIPYTEIYKKNNKLLLLENNESFFEFGKKWPEISKYALGSESYSMFPSTEIGRGVDTATRTFAVSTVFTNVSSELIGFYNNINTLVIMRDNSEQYDVEFPNSYFTATRLKFPLTLYNFSNDYFDIYGRSLTRSEEIGNASRRNAFNLYYNYIWSERGNYIFSQPTSASRISRPDGYSYYVTPDESYSYYIQDLV